MVIKQRHHLQQLDVTKELKQTPRIFIFIFFILHTVYLSHTNRRLDLSEKEKERDCRACGARLRKGEQHNIKFAIWPVGYKTSQQLWLCRPQSEYTAQHAGTFCFNLPLTWLQPCFSKSGLNEPQGRMPHKQTNMRRCITRIWHSSMAPQGGWGAHSLLLVAWHREKQEERVGRQEKKDTQKVRGEKMTAYASVPLSTRNRNVAVGSRLPHTATHLFQTVVQPSAFISFNLRFTCPVSHFTSELHITVFNRLRIEHLEATPEGDANVSVGDSRVRFHHL